MLTFTLQKLWAPLAACADLDREVATVFVPGWSCCICDEEYKPLHTTGSPRLGC